MGLHYMWLKWSNEIATLTCVPIFIIGNPNTPLQLGEKYASYHNSSLSTKKHFWFKSSFFWENYVYKLASVKSRNRTKITSTKTRKHAPKSNIFHLLLLSEFFELLIFSLSHHYQTRYELKIQTTCFRNKHRKKCLPPFCQKSIFPGYCWRFGVVSTVSDLLEAWVWLLKRARPRLQYTRRPL